MDAPRSTPLHDLQAAQGARFAASWGWEIAEDYGDPRREYQAVRSGAGALDLAHHGTLGVTGRDRAKYLHNMLSNDVKGLAPGRGCYAALLDHQGRMEADVYVHAFAEEIRLECGPAGAERLFAQLRKFIIADQVAVEDRTGTVALLSLQGPGARAAMTATVEVELEGLDPLEHRVVERGAGEWTVVRRDRTGRDGYDLWLPAGEAAAVWKAWAALSGVAPVGARALDWLRTEAGIPLYGADMDATSLPMEFGLMHAVSLTKGCYRGQEIVARVLHRGHLNRGLAGIAFEGDAPPPRGTPLRSADAAAGDVTSAAFSPALGRWLALAVVKDAFRAPGTRLETAASGSVLTGVVVALPVS